jgi:hypothetical protein
MNFPLTDGAFLNEEELTCFMAKVEKQPNCWLWKGATTGASASGSGYGYFKYRGKVKRAHQISFQHFVRPLTIGEQVLHVCNNELCVNPAHLKTGTQSENIKQSYDQGRRSTSLTKEQVLEIKAELSQGIRTNFLSRKYGVRSSTISAIKYGRLHP